MSNIEKALQLMERAAALGLTKDEQSAFYAAILAEHGLQRAPAAPAPHRVADVQQALPLSTRTAQEEVRAALPELRDAFARYQRSRSLSGGGGSAVRLVYRVARDRLESVRRMVAHVALAAEQAGGVTPLSRRMVGDGLQVRRSDIVSWSEGCRAPDAFEAALLAAIAGRSSSTYIEMAARAREVINLYRAALGMQQTHTVLRGEKQ
jgi:hypothetical protein